MTVTEAADLLEVRPSTVYALCRAGLLGHLRIGTGRGTIRITPEDVERFRADARAKGANPAAVRVAYRQVPVPVARKRSDAAFTFKYIKPKG